MRNGNLQQSFANFGSEFQQLAPNSRNNYFMYFF